MDYEKLLNQARKTDQYILEVVDEYTLYCFYMKIDNLELHRAYSSPFREDNSPSFGIWRTSYTLMTEYYWRDLATGQSGDIFKLIKLIERLDTREQVYQRINEDFDLGLGLEKIESRPKIILYTPPEDSAIKIRIAPIPLTEAGKLFWNQFNIGQDLLDLYHVNQIKWYWSYEEQPYPTTVGDPAFAYRIGQYYQTYDPYAPRKYKFRNDFPENYFFGYQQLSNSGEKLIIDKSSKDVIFCRRLVYEAVCGKSETTMIPAQKMFELRGRFREHYLMLDNDKAGRDQAEKYVGLYPWLKVRFLPQEIAKDKTDMCKKIGFEETKRIVDDLLI